MTQARAWPLPPRTPDGGLTIHHISDTHHGYRPWSYDESNHLLRDLDEGLAMVPDVLVHTGDIIDGADVPAEDTYAKVWFNVAGEERGVPSVWCVGNHDLRTRTPNTRAAWEAVYGRPGNTFVDVNGWRIVTFCVDVHGWNEPWIVPAATWAWLDSVAASAPGPVILANHFPPQELGGLTDIDHLRPPAELAELVSGHPNIVGMLAGHTHWAPDDPRSAAMIQLGNRTHFPVLTDVSAMLTLPAGLGRDHAAQVPSISAMVTVTPEVWEVRYRHHGPHAWSGPGGLRVTRLDLVTGVESRGMGSPRMPVCSSPAPTPEPEPELQPEPEPEPGEPTEPVLQTGILWGTCPTSLKGTDFTAKNTAYGPLTIRRCYNGEAPNMPATWADSNAAADVGHRASCWSGKPPLEAVAAGALDGQILAFLRSIPRDHLAWVTIWHEPDSKIRSGKFTLSTYLAGFKRWCELVQQVKGEGWDRLHSVQIVTTWSGTNPSQGSTYEDLWPGDGLVDCYGLDGYSHVGSANTLWGPGVEFARAKGIPWCVPELGYGNQGSQDVAWMLDQIEYLTATPSGGHDSALFGCWFDTAGPISNPTPGGNPAWVAAARSASQAFHVDPAAFVP